MNLPEDDRKAFGADPPGMASVAIMNDSDNTGEQSMSDPEDIEIYWEVHPCSKEP